MKLPVFAIAATVALPVIALGSAVLVPDAATEIRQAPIPAVAGRRATGPIPRFEAGETVTRAAKTRRPAPIVGDAEAVSTKATAGPRYRYRSSPPAELYIHAKSR